MVARFKAMRVAPKFFLALFFLSAAAFVAIFSACRRLNEWAYFFSEGKAGSFLAVGVVSLILIFIGLRQKSLANKPAGENAKPEGTETSQKYAA
jgi:hypothetical protein